MTQETLEKANDLNKDIKNINKVLEDKKANRWIRVIGARNEELCYSVKFQQELAEWLEKKKEQYQKELENL